MATLYELSDYHQQLLLALENEEISEDAFADTLELIKTEFEDKLEGYVHVIKTIEMQKDAAQKEIERLNQYKQTRENKVKALKDAMLEAMKAINKQKIATGVFTVRCQNSPPSLVVKDEKAIPEGYKVPQPPKIDKKQLLKDLKDNIIEATENIYIKQGQHIRIS